MALSEIGKTRGLNPRDRERIPRSLLDLLPMVSQLNEIKRQGWVERGIEDPESVAEHSFQVSFLTAFVASQRGLNVEKAVMMAMIHDFPEVVTGDETPYDNLPPEEKAKALQHWTPPSQEMLKAKRMAEEKALKDMTRKLPLPFRREIKALWSEYAEGATEEARLVQQADKIQRLLQAKQYRDLLGAGFPIESFLSEALQSGDPELARLAQQIAKELGEVGQASAPVETNVVSLPPKKTTQMGLWRLLSCLIRHRRHKNLPPVA